ncbi:uncharacterized protein LOC132759426 [Ruditapes philippinarum]|uniref:uncharacterized protein LOC132759426 n=1 Tax=Ruditapes philippinarum TaxID=129788 RepID=UPI00295B92A8|nr:uncharacterized protein LOC132759426 [Ruditapes philippinarum]
METIKFKLSMQHNLILVSSMLIILCAIIPSVSTRPTDTDNGDNIKLRKRPSLANIRHSIHELEQIERYYQQLLIRGYLQDSDLRRLELLQEFIELLRNRLRALTIQEQS